MAIYIQSMALTHKAYFTFESITRIGKLTTYPISYVSLSACRENDTCDCVRSKLQNSNSDEIFLKLN